MDDKTFKELLDKIDKHFSDSKNREEFLNYLEEEQKKPYNIHLLCNEISCKYNRPEDPDIGTICWCDKYLNEQEELCEKECNKRWWYEMQIGSSEKEEE